jgi:hypothetical protein
MSFKLAAAFAACALATASMPAEAQKKAPAEWDGLVKIKSKKVDLVYLLPQADFRGYTKVALDPSQVSFQKDWKRNHNGMDATGRVTDEDARRIIQEAQTGFDEILKKAYEKAGYTVVSAPGPDVLRISTGIANLDVAAPDTMQPGITRTYTRDAGEGTLVVEARDSVSGALLGRAVDGRAIGDSGPYLRNRSTNAGEFERVFREWAEAAAKGLTELKAMSPIDTSGSQRR